MESIWKLIYTTFIIGLFVIGMFLLAIQIPLFGMELKVVKSGSMEPIIPVGSVIVVDEAISYKVHDVITFGPDTKKQIPTTHRIISVDQTGESTLFTTKGDANTVNDAKPVAPDDIIGKVVFTIPLLGFVLDFARTPLGFFVLVGIPAFLLIVDEIKNITREVLRLGKKRRRVEPLKSHERAPSQLDLHVRRLERVTPIEPRRRACEVEGAIVRLKATR